MTIALVACLGCSPRAASDIVVARDTLADTVRVAITAPMTLTTRRWQADSVQLLWTPPDLRRIRAVAHHDGTVYVSDGRTVKGWRSATGEQFVVGRNGAGPGEYRRVAAMAVGLDGMLHLLDESQSKIVSFNADGSAARDTLIDPSWGAGLGLRTFAPIDASGGWVTATDRGVVDPGGLEDSVLVTLHRPNVPHVVLFQVGDGTWQFGGRYLAKRQVFGRQAIVAAHVGHGAAVTTGEEYLIGWWRPNASPSYMQITRQWQRASTAGMQELPAAERASLGESGPALLETLAAQELGSQKNALDNLVLMANGVLLVRVVDSTHRYHPNWLGRFPELRPPHYTWELYGPEGALLGQLLLPSRFVPYLWRECELLGVSPDDDGMESLVAVALGDACGWVGG